MVELIVFASFALILLTLLSWWRNIARIPDRFPPGPYGLPLLGYWRIFLSDNILSGLGLLHQTYGSVISLNIGPGKRSVVIGDFETLKVRNFVYRFNKNDNFLRNKSYFKQIVLQWKYSIYDPNYKNILFNSLSN